MPDQVIVLLGTVLVFVGIILAFLAFILPATRSGRLQARGGAVILIGPFPIVFGSDMQKVKVLTTLVIILVVVLIVLFLVQVV